MRTRPLLLGLLWTLMALPVQACGPLTLAFYDLGLLHHRDASGFSTGIDVEVVQALAERSHCRFETSVDSRARIWRSMADGSLDLTVSGISTPERELFAAFLPYFKTRNFVVHRRDLPASARTAAGFLANNSLRVGVVKSFKHGPTYDAWLDALRSQGRVTEVGDFESLVRIFSARRIDALLALPTSWLHHARALRLEETTELLDWSPRDAVVHGLVVSRQRVPEPVRERLRQAMDSLNRDGTLHDILRRHVGSALAKDMVMQAP